jgi:hypothetical protein
VEALTDPDPDPPETLTDTPTQELAIPDAKPPRSARGGTPTPAPYPSHSSPMATTSVAGPTIQQRADPIVRAYHQRLDGMCNWPAVLGIVKKAIKADRWSDQAIEDALLRIADDSRPLTTDSLRIELDGMAARASPRANKATERLAERLAVVAHLEAEERGEIS